MTKKLLWKSAIIRFFRVKVVQIVCKQPVKGNLHILVILNYRLFKILQHLLHIWNCMVKDFLKVYILSFYGQYYFFANLFTFVTFGHQTWDFEAGGSNWPPPPSVSWFSSTHSRDIVFFIEFYKNFENIRIIIFLTIFQN